MKVFAVLQTRYQKKCRAAKIPSALLAFFLLCLFPRPLPCSSGEAELQKSQVLEKLGELEKDIQQLKGSLSQIESKRRTILGEIEYLDLLAEKGRKELQLTSSRLDYSRAEYEKKKRSFEKRRESMLAELGYTRRRLLDLYKYGNMGYLEVAFASTEPDELFQNISRMRYLLAKDGREIRKAKEDMALIRIEMDGLARNMSEISSLLAEKQSKTGEIETIRNRKTATLTNVNQEKRTYLQSLDELRKAALKLQKLLHDAGRPDLDKKLLEIIKVPFTHYRGSLDWPCEGKILKQFGKLPDEKLRTFIYEKGIDIEGDLNENVQCIFDGVVVFSDWFEGYGKLLIVSHGEDHYSIYAHLSEILVKKNERVSRWQSIARLGDTGNLEKPSLHFEIRCKDAAENPFAWLKPR